MNYNLRDIIRATICKFNVEIDESNNFVAAISPNQCEQTCDYCRLFAEYICKEMERQNDNEQSDKSNC